MAAGYLVIKAPIKSLVQQSDGCLLAYRTRWSAWYGPPHSFPHICAGNYSLDVKYPQMSHLKRGYMLPAHFEGNHLPPSSSSFSTKWTTGLAMGQSGPGRQIRNEKEATEIWNDWEVQRRRKAESRERMAFSPHLSVSVVHTSFQTQTYTPVMECKYLNMGMVGCFFLPSKMCCLGENGPKKTTRESLYFDFSKVPQQRPALPIFQSPLRVNE